MELIVISHDSYFTGESEIINNLFNNGLRILHIRKPSTDMGSFIRLMNEIDNAYHDRIVLHQFHELAAEFGIIRLHYPEKTRKQFIEHKIGIKSTSIHDLKCLDQLLGYDYTFFGPVFNSLSKVGYAGIADQNFRLPKAPLKVIALGGICADNAAEAIKMGFNGLALKGTIWNDTEMAVYNFKKIQTLCIDLM